jgi:antitoxin MazE
MVSDLQLAAGYRASGLVHCMKTEFKKWGNSFALRIPSGVAREVGASVGKTAEMTIENGAPIVKVEANKKRRRYSLEQLL